MYSLAILQFAMENGHENTICKFANFHGYVILPYFFGFGMVVLYQG